MDAEADNPRRRPKGDKRDRTRAALLAAAREVISELGYERTTLQAVAERAGMSSGAIYGNFRNRDALLIALAEAWWAPIKPQFAPGSSFADKMRALAQAVIDIVPERRPVAASRLAGMAYTLGSPESLREVARVTARDYAEGAAWLAAVASPEELTMPPEQLVVVIHALTEGLVFQRLMTPELVPDAVIFAAFGALARQGGAGQ